MDCVNWRTLASSPFMQTLTDHVEHLMQGTTERRFVKCYSESTINYEEEPSWVLQTSRIEDGLSDHQREFLNSTIMYLGQLSLRRKEDLHLRIMATLGNCFGSQLKGSHTRLRIGDIV